MTIHPQNTYDYYQPNNLLLKIFTIIFVNIITIVENFKYLFFKQKKISIIAVRFLRVKNRL